ncbi:MAG: hypothetical protein ACP5G7_00175 [Anaerolineae bacterium]
MSGYLDRFGLEPGYPTQHHAAAAASALAYWAKVPNVEAVLLTCSCARNHAVPSSCVDLALLVPPTQEERFWEQELRRFESFAESDEAIAGLAAIVPWSAVDIDIFTGEFPVPYHGYTSGADDYEVRIGNLLAWSSPLHTQGRRFEILRHLWLPYYDENTAIERQAMVLAYACNNLDHVEPYARRALLFQARKRLQHAAEEYLQALFIKHRLYPIAYDKWVAYQLRDVLGAESILLSLQQALGVELSVDGLSRAASLLSELLDDLA